MNWADWTFRCPSGTEYAIDAEGNVLLPEGRKIAKGETFTVGPRNAPNVVRIPDGVALNPARRRHSAVADLVSLRVDAPEWFDEMMRRDNKRLDLYPGPKWFEGGSTSWTRYSAENDEIKVERIDPHTVYYESGNNPWNTEGDRRFRVVQSSGGSHIPVRPIDLREMMTDPPPPYVRYRDPQTYLTPVAIAVKIALDGSVN